MTGSRSQSNYAAANTYQDALARHRISNGQKCISLNLGAIVGVGFAAEHKLGDMLKREGFLGMRKAELLACLEYCCDPALEISDPSHSQIATGLGLLEQLPPNKVTAIYWARKPLFSVLRLINAGIGTADQAQATQTTVDHTALLQAATNPLAATQVVLQALVAKLSRLLSIPPADIDPARPIFAFGIDSLVALEVRDWFMKEIGADVVVSEILGKESLYALAEAAAAKRSVGHQE